MKTRYLHINKHTHKHNIFSNEQTYINTRYCFFDKNKHTYKHKISFVINKHTYEHNYTKNLLNGLWRSWEAWQKTAGSSRLT